MNTAIIILAAGKSSRMGFPKQSLEIEGKSLIKRTLDEALKSVAYPITVVVGANKKDFIEDLKDAPVTIVDNNNWEKGMGTSIKIGLAGTYMVSKEIEVVIILAIDMPFVSIKLINELIEKAKDEETTIVASKYGNTIGIPALFKRSVFNDILDLKDNEGAKKLILKNKATLKLVDFPEGVYDLDTPEDYKNFLQMKA